MRAVRGVPRSVLARTQLQCFHALCLMPAFVKLSLAIIELERTWNLSHAHLSTSRIILFLHQYYSTKPHHSQSPHTAMTYPNINTSPFPSSPSSISDLFRVHFSYFFSISFFFIFTRCIFIALWLMCRVHVCVSYALKMDCGKVVWGWCGLRRCLVVYDKSVQPGQQRRPGKISSALFFFIWNQYNWIFTWKDYILLYTSHTCSEQAEPNDTSSHLQQHTHTQSHTWFFLYQLRVMVGGSVVDGGLDLYGGW